MNFSCFRQIILRLVLGALLFLVVGCVGRATTTAVSQSASGLFTLILQPLPQEMHRLSFSFAGISALGADGSEVVLPLDERNFSGSDLGKQLRLANVTLPPGRYRGVALRIDRAGLSGAEGDFDLLPPQEELVVELPFIIREQQAETLMLSLAADRIVTDGVLFTPKFALWKPERLLPNLKGFVSNSQTGILTVFNKRTSEIVGHIRVGKRPHGLALDQRRGWLYVALAGDNAVSVIEVNNGTVLGRVALRLGDEPMELALTNDGRVLFVLNRGSETVSVVNTSALFETGRVRLLSQPDGIFLGHDERLVYVTHASSGTLSLIDPLTAALKGTVPVADAPVNGISSRDGRWLYLINEYSADVTVLTTSSLHRQEQIYVGHGALSVTADRGTELLYIGKDNGEIAVVDPRSLIAIDTFFLPPEPIAEMSIDREENALFAVLAASGDLIKVELIGKQLLGRLDLEEGSYAVAVMGER